ncbi:MarR family transcriptional regulator [Arthrobacter sp. NEB 688]|uniref:helix-turn-helix transcriptional regulator n=1 Tax=Arthrobacter sp. NEB 688 TaxID=904039 RepID=UPI00156735DB|nr:MarR family transcriptional regulator [Arthrobacter sp. NEB 688]QKE84838.1 winged helix-turn-helix transcriptional regulator [Arthrobacter sp. NEB 688]
MVNAAASVDESRTRDRLLRVVSQEGPVSITALVDRLGLTETAVRRHVDNLHAEGLVLARDAAGPRRRGRPAKEWVLTDAGHRALASDYDDLAGEALRFLRRTGGESAVQAFAEERVAHLEARLAGRLEHAGDDARSRADALVDALNTEGYSASARPVGTPGGPAALTGVQLCQGHCPVQHVATEFPELCEAETEAFSRLLGVHVQRLATLAHGDHVCTTFVPTPTERPSR